MSVLPSATFSFEINCFQKYVFQEYEYSVKQYESK